MTAFAKVTIPLVRFALLKWSRLYQDQQTLFRLVRTFNDFTEDNDPWKEHDFGSVEFKGGKYFWKIDYYEKSLKYGSEDASNTAITTRVMTIMHSSEY